MSDTRSEPFGGKRFGCALALMLCFLTFLWLLSGLLALGHEEQCRHGFVEPGGSYEAVWTWLPPNPTCVYENGESYSSSIPLTSVWWISIAAMAFWWYLRHSNEQKRLEAEEEDAWEEEEWDEDDDEAERA